MGGQQLSVKGVLVDVQLVGMVMLPPFGWMLGMSSLQVEPEKIVRKSPYFA